MADITDIEFKALRGYPWLPCPICHGVEGCDHSYPERARAALPNLFISGYFTDRTLAGDRLDPATGKIVNDKAGK